MNLREIPAVKNIIAFLRSDNRKVFYILCTRYQHVLVDYFKKYIREERSAVKYFVSDIYTTYDEITKTYFPQLF